MKCGQARAGDGGWRREEAQEGGDISVLVADSCCHKAETSIIL